MAKKNEIDEVTLYEYITDLAKSQLEYAKQNGDFNMNAFDAAELAINNVKTVAKILGVTLKVRKQTIVDMIWAVDETVTKLKKNLS